MNILIIGGTDFIGPVLANNLFNKGHNVFLFHRSKHSQPSPYTHIQGNCENAEDLLEAVELAAPDIIVHMIAYFENHITVLEKALCKKPMKTIVISSADVYKGYEILSGLSNQEPVPVPFNEHAPLRNILYPYRSKFDTDFAYNYEKILVERAALKSPVLNTSILRLGMVYGKNDPSHRFGDWIHKLAEGVESIEIPKSYANLRLCKCYVENIANGIALAVENSNTDKIYNLSDEWVYTELEWLQHLASKLNWKGEILFTDGDMPGFNSNQHFILDTSKIRQEIKYTEIFDVDYAIDNTIEWELS